MKLIKSPWSLFLYYFFETCKVNEMGSQLFETKISLKI